MCKTLLLPDCGRLLLQSEDDTFGRPRLVYCSSMRIDGTTVVRVDTSWCLLIPGCACVGACACNTGGVSQSAQRSSSNIDYQPSPSNLQGHKMALLSRGYCRHQHGSSRTCLYQPAWSGISPVWLLPSRGLPRATCHTTVGFAELNNTSSTRQHRTSSSTAKRTRLPSPTSPGAAANRRRPLHRPVASDNRLTVLVVPTALSPPDVGKKRADET